MKLYPETYPIDRILSEIKADLDTHNCLLLKAETGAGKTTRLPPYLVSQNCGKVLVLEPRRLAAKLSAARCAEALDTRIGDQVGHHIRFDKKSSAQTELLFITEGLFLSYLKMEPDLNSFNIIILDEFHERSIHTDVALALLRRLQKTTRPDLKIIVMSATLDTEKLEEYLEKPLVRNISGRTFPLSIEYKDKLDPVTAIFEMAQHPLCTKNILVFLHGVGPIKSLYDQLQKNPPRDYQVVKLYSSLSKAEQDLVFDDKGKKIILATNIAETSLTLPDVTGVIDLGLERRASFAPWSGMPLLLLEKISKASATQRAGRAGRVQEGIVFRLYSETDFVTRENFTPSEVKRVELSHYLLDILELGISLDSLHWFETPEEKNLEKAISLLELLGAFHEEKLSPKGVFMAQNPLHPRFGSMLFDQDLERNADLILACSILSEGMILSSNTEFNSEDSEICDLSIQCDLMKSYLYRDKSLSDYSNHYLDLKKAARVKELYEALCKKFHIKSTSPKKTNPEDLSLALLHGFPDRVAMKKISSVKGKKGNSKISYNFCMGRGGILSKSSSLGSQAPEFIIVLEALENPKANAATGTLIHSASRIKPELLLSSPLIETNKESIFNEKKETLKIQTQYKYKNLTIKTLDEEHSKPKGMALIEIIKENWPWPFPDDNPLKLYHQRISLINIYKEDHPFAFFQDEMFDLFLESFIDENTEFSKLKDQGLESLIESQMAPQDLFVLNELTPLEIKLENAKSFPLYYDEERPYIMARIQDLYGVKIHPTLFQGKVPILLKLLSPASRIAQMTLDLPSFWQGSWSLVKQDLKSNYPKHHWPDSPESAPAIRLKKDLPC